MWLALSALAFGQGQSYDLGLVGPGFACSPIPGLETSTLPGKGRRCLGTSVEVAVAPLVRYESGLWAEDLIPTRFSLRTSGAAQWAARDAWTVALGFSAQPWAEVEPRATGFYDLDLGYRRSVGRRGIVRVEVGVPIGQRQSWVGEGVPTLTAGFGASTDAGPWTWSGEVYLGSPVGRLLSPAEEHRVADGIRAGGQAAAIWNVGAFSPIAQVHARVTLPRIGAYRVPVGIPIEPAAGVVGRWKQGSMALTVGRGAWLGPGSARWRYHLTLRLTPQPSTPSVKPPLPAVAAPAAPPAIEARPPGTTRGPGFPRVEPELEDKPDGSEGAGGCGDPVPCTASPAVDDPPPFPDIELLFERGLATLGPDSDDDLARLATFLNTAGGTRWVVVEGVASPDGSAWFNYGLALDRAAYVVKRLVTLGVHPDRLTLRARGELAGGAMARRVDVRWAQTPEISGPGEAPWEREMEEVGP